MNSPFPGVDGTPDILKQQAHAQTPEAPGAGDPLAGMSPFLEAMDVDALIAHLRLDRPLSLYIPNKERYPGYEFRIINSIPREIADAHNKGFREVTDPDLANLFTDLVAGTDKVGKAYRPILCARPKKVGDEVRKRHRMQLRSLYSGMDPRNRELDGKYSKNVRDGKDASSATFDGANWRIRV